MIRQLAAALLLAASWIGTGHAADNGTPSFRLVNRGHSAVRELFVTPGGDATWGRNRLDGRSVAPGAAFPLRLRADGTCIFDIRAVFADGTREDRRGLNTCRLDEVAVGEEGAVGGAAMGKPAGDPSFRLINRGSVAITELFATPAGTGTWGQNRLPPGGVPGGTATLVRMAPSGQCRFDLRVVFANHRALEQHRADLCRITEVPVP